MACRHNVFLLESDYRVGEKRSNPVYIGVSSSSVQGSFFVSTQRVSVVVFLKLLYSYYNIVPFLDQ